MKLIYFYQYFTTPKGSYGTRVYEFSKNWVARGHEVIIVTSVYSKSDIKASKFIETQYIDGITVKIININIDNKQPLPKRIITFLIYSLCSIYFALSIKYDVIIASSGPITVGLPGIIGKKFRRKKLIFEVRDLWPDCPIELGILKNSLLKKLTYSFETLCYKYSDLIVALSPGMKDNIIARFGNAKVISVTNSANIKLFSKNKEQINDSKLKGKKFAIYTGNIGYVNNSELLYLAARKLKELGRGDIIILIIGDGKQKKYLMEKSKDLETILFYEPLSKDKLVNYIRNAIVSIIPLAPIPILSTSSPNKLFESMAAGVPVIQTTNGWIKKLINDVGCGYTVNPNSEDELVDKLIFLADNPQERVEMGVKGMEHAKSHFDKDILSAKMISSIESIKDNAK